MLAGYFVSRPQLDPETFVGDPDSVAGRLAYDWLREQMDLRGLQRPAEDAYPIWAWFHCYHAQRPKPDLRTRLFRRWTSDTRHVLLTLSVPRNQVLLSDYHAWHMPLNYGYLGTERETLAFDKKLARHGLAKHWVAPLPVPELDAELKESWQQIFDFKRCRILLGLEPEDQPIQATFYALHRADLLEAVEFGAKKPQCKLFG
jgi:hypothetical protein